jgi:glutathione S-transferase
MTALIAPPAAPLTLYWHPRSGHAHRAQLMLSLLKLPHTLEFVDFATKQHKTPDYLRLNAFGQVPVLDDNGTIVADSNAILAYLALRYQPADAPQPWLPRDPLGTARVQRWLSVVRAWLARIEALDGFVPMEPTAAGLRQAGA